MLRKTNNYLHRLFRFDSQYSLTCAVNAITGESLIAFTPVTPRPSRGAHVRCNRSTGGVCMTDSRCIGSTVPRIWINIYVDGKIHRKLSGHTHIGLLRVSGSPRSYCVLLGLLVFR